MPDRIRLPDRRLGTSMTHQPDRLSDAHFAHSLALLAARKPLVHCMTNDVVQTFTANVLLALNASPAMVIDSEEAVQFAALADALLINVGTLTHERRDAMQAAVQSANNTAKPWVLDPVAIGALTLRTEFCQYLLRQRPAAVRGNASEILALAGEAAGGRGVDAQHQAETALNAAKQLAQQYQTLICVTGETDFITDGVHTLSVTGGSELMTRVVGTGCALSAVVAAFCALPGDRLAHVASACRVMSLAGEQAAKQADAPASFATLLIDALWYQIREGSL